MQKRGVKTSFLLYGEEAVQFTIPSPLLLVYTTVINLMVYSILETTALLY